MKAWNLARLYILHNENTSFDEIRVLWHTINARIRLSWHFVGQFMEKCSCQVVSHEKKWLLISRSLAFEWLFSRIMIDVISCNPSASLSVKWTSSNYNLPSTFVMHSIMIHDIIHQKRSKRGRQTKCISGKMQIDYKYCKEIQNRLFRKVGKFHVELTCSSRNGNIYYKFLFRKKTGLFWSRCNNRRQWQRGRWFDYDSCPLPLKHFT